MARPRAWHDHGHATRTPTIRLPVEQREVTAILVLTASVGGRSARAAGAGLDQEDQQGLGGSGRVADSRDDQPVRHVRRSAADDPA